MKTLQMPVSSTTNRESLPLLLSSLATRINRRLSSLWYNKREHSEHSFVAKKEFPSRNSMRTKEREGRFLRSPCHSRPCTGINNQVFGERHHDCPNRRCCSCSSSSVVTVFLTQSRTDFSFRVERSSSSSTLWKLDKDRDPWSVWEGMICSSSCYVSSSRSYMFQQFNHVVSVYTMCLLLL